MVDCNKIRVSEPVIKKPAGKINLAIVVTRPRGLKLAAAIKGYQHIFGKEHEGKPWLHLFHLIVLFMLLKFCFGASFTVTSC